MDAVSKNTLWQMDTLIDEQLKAWAKKETLYQLIIALGGVLLVISFMTKHFKTIVDALPSIRKALGYVQAKWFSQAIFRADVLRFMNSMQLKLNEIEKEVKHNGGGSLKDVVKRLEGGHDLILEKIEHLKGLRDISDKFDTKMNFKFDPEMGVTFISESFLSGFGCKESDVLYYAYSELIHPDDRAEMWEKWQRACEKKTPFSDVQRIRDTTGEFQECCVKAIPIVIDGKIKEFKGVIELNYK